MLWTMTDAELRRVLLAVLHDPPALARLPAGDVDTLLRVLRRARLLGRIAVQLNDANLMGALPTTVADQLAGAMAVAEARARHAVWELDRIVWALRGVADLRLIALKGSAYLMAALPNARGRTFADVDMLVPEAALRAVEERLRENGWLSADLDAYDELYYRQWAHEIPAMSHLDRQVEVDLHRNIVMRTARLKPSAAQLLAAARPLAGSSVAVLAPTDMVLHAATHLFYGGDLDNSLRELIDIDVLLRHFAVQEPEFWSKFWHRATELDLRRPAYYALRYSNKLLGTPVPARVLNETATGAPPAVVRLLMDRLVPVSLFPSHPDRQALGATLARLLLFCRSHWVRMPPLLLLRHLGTKAYLRYLRKPAAG